MKTETCPKCGAKMEPTATSAGVLFDCPDCWYTPPGITAGYDVFVDGGKLWKNCETLDKAMSEGKEAKKQFETVAIYQMFTDGSCEIVGLVEK